jgi:hypothetical protein
MNHKHLIIENLLKYESKKDSINADRYYKKAYQIFKNNYSKIGVEWFIIIHLEVMSTLKRFNEIEQN